jgi:hypothetical protein
MNFQKELNRRVVAALPSVLNEVAWANGIGGYDQTTRKVNPRIAMNAANNPFQGLGTLLDGLQMNESKDLMAPAPGGMLPQKAASPPDVGRNLGGGGIQTGQRVGNPTAQGVKSEDQDPMDAGPEEPGGNQNLLRTLLQASTRLAKTLRLLANCMRCLLRNIPTTPSRPPSSKTDQIPARSDK